MQLMCNRRYCECGVQSKKKDTRVRNGFRKRINEAKNYLGGEEGWVGFL